MNTPLARSPEARDPRDRWRVNTVIETGCFVLFTLAVLANTGLAGLGFPEARSQALIAVGAVALVLLRTPAGRMVALVCAIELVLLGAGNMQRYLRMLDGSELPTQRALTMGAAVLAANVAFCSLAIERVEAWRRSRQAHNRE